ncbi:MAG: dolichyl-phosphate-mannose-protein mannosyltransferase [Paenibacillus sp.]|nr:dolichyl-phosphate-mannose-protein mannosyltransferase [Paenibacillus sp.]
MGEDWNDRDVMKMESTGQPVLEKQLARLLAVFGLALFVWMTLWSYVNTTAYFTPDIMAMVWLLVAGGVVAGIGYGCRGVHGKVYVTLLLVVTLVPRLVWVSVIDTAPISDFYDMHAGALQAADGDFTFASNDYFTRWIYQIGFTLYEALVIQLFGSSLLALKLFNVLFQAGTAVIVWKLASSAFDERSGRAAGLLYAVYVPNIIMCSVLTNQHISVFLFMLGLWVLLRRRLAGRLDWLWVGLCFAAGNFMRPLGSFFIVGAIVFLILFELIPRIRERRRPAALALSCVLLVAAYGLVQQAVSLTLVQTGVLPQKLSNPEPYWKFMVGLNPESNGGWSQADTDYVLQYPIGEERNQAERELMNRRLQDKGAVAALFVSKAKAMWGAEDSAPMWSLPNIDRPYLYSKLVQTERIQYLLLALFGLAAMGICVVKGMSAEACLWLLLLLGYAALHLVIEVQTRYRFDIFPCVFILQSMSVKVLLDSIERFRHGKRQKRGRAERPT